MGYSNDFVKSTVNFDLLSNCRFRFEETFLGHGANKADILVVIGWFKESPRSKLKFLDQEPLRSRCNQKTCRQLVAIVCPTTHKCPATDSQNTGKLSNRIGVLLFEIAGTAEVHVRKSVSNLARNHNDGVDPKILDLVSKVLFYPDGDARQQDRGDGCCHDPAGRKKSPFPVFTDVRNSLEAFCEHYGFSQVVKL